MVLCVIKAALKATKNLTLTLSCSPASTHRRTPSSHPNVPFLLAPIPTTPLHQKCPVQWGCPPRKRALELLTLFLLVELILPNLFLSESLANCRSIWQLCCFVYPRYHMYPRSGEWILEAHLQLSEGFVPAESLLMMKPMRLSAGRET